MRKRFFKNAATFLSTSQIFSRLSKHHEWCLDRGPRARHDVELSRIEPQVEEAKRLLKTAVFDPSITDVDLDAEIEEAFLHLSESERMQDVIDYVICNSDLIRYAERIKEVSLNLMHLQALSNHGVRRSLAKKTEAMQRRVTALNRFANPKVPPTEAIKRLAAAEVTGRLKEIRPADPDLAASLLHEKYPWMRVASAAFMDDARRPGPFRMRPIILAGSPGSGKTSWSRDVARITGAHFTRVDLSASGGGVFELQGQEIGWSGSQPGAVVRGICDSLCINPVIVVEEVDLGTGWTTSSGKGLPGACAALMSMIEPETAKAWRCPSSGAILDLRQVTWIMTSNHVGRIPSSLLDRCQVIHVPDISERELGDVAWRHAEDRVPGAGDVVLQAMLDRKVRRKPVRTLRSVRKLVDALEDIVNRPRYH